MSRAVALGSQRASRRVRRGEARPGTRAAQGHLDQESQGHLGPDLDPRAQVVASAAHTGAASAPLAGVGQELAPSTRALPDRMRREERPRPGVGQAPAGAGGGRLTLGDVVAGVWEGLLAAGSAQCPVCRGRMEWHRDGGRCGGCGSALS